MARILLAEDDADIRYLVELRLAAIGHTVVAAPDGTTAAERFRESDFDLLVTDVTMPGMNGVELIRWVRAEGRRPMLPVLVISALSSAEVLGQLRAVGATAYLTKPFSLLELVKQVEALLAGP